MVRIKTEFAGQVGVSFVVSALQHLIYDRYEPNKIGHQTVLSYSVHINCICLYCVKVQTINHIGQAGSLAVQRSRIVRPSLWSGGE